MRHRKNILKTAAAVIIISLTVSANTGFAYAQESAAVTEQAAEETSDGSADETSADSYTANTTDDPDDDPAGQPADPAEQNTDDQSADAAGENTAGQTADAAGENTDEQTAEDAGENTAGRTEENAAGQTERSTAVQTQDPSEETYGTSDEDGESSGEQNPAYTLTRLALSDEELTYTGEALTKAEVLVYGTKSEAASGTASGAASEENGFLLIKDADYTIEYSGNVNAGTAQVTVTGIGSYEGQTLTESFEILPAAITDISLKYASMTYTGKPRTQSKTTEVRCGKTILQRGTDYTISYTGNVEPGTAEMTVTGSGNYTGSITKTFTIRAKLAEAVLKYSSLKYTGKARTQTGTTKVTAKIGKETRVLTRGTDYKISYKNNTNAGTATMTITGIGSYKGTLKKKFKIAPVSLKSASISASSEMYTGKAITTKAKVKAKVAGETVTLKQDRDYTISYKKLKLPTPKRCVEP